MRNRAKCKLCNSVIESFSNLDYVTCVCGEIAIDGGDVKLWTMAKDYSNFLRVDDEGNEIVVTMKSDEVMERVALEKPERKEMIDMLDEMVKSYERLPEHAKEGFITHYDMMSLMILLSSILKSGQ